MTGFGTLAALFWSQYVNGRRRPGDEPTEDINDASSEGRARTATE